MKTITINSTHYLRDLKSIAEKNPLIHNITNFVVMNNTANALLAVGASPVMAHAMEEVEALTAVSAALVINIGTLSDRWVASMKMAVHAAKKSGVPIVFDPVGVGATAFRNQTAQEILAIMASNEALVPMIIRGNASEIMALAGLAHSTKGVDSTARSVAAVDAAASLAQKIGGTVVVSGEVDYVVSVETNDSQGVVVTIVEGGHPLMPQVTGMGCTASALCGAFIAVNHNSHEAGVNAMQAMAQAGETAGKTAQGTGSFAVAFMDALYNLNVRST